MAVEVGLYKNLFDTSDPEYMNKIIEAATWKKVSEATGLSVEVCIDYWTSLKRSARYYARPQRIPYKSGAEGGVVEKKYRDEWPLADYMAFYTPPALKDNEKHVSICNTPESESQDAASSHGSNVVDFVEGDTGVYVSNK